jgi:hypothetical protein
MVAPYGGVVILELQDKYIKSLSIIADMRLLIFMVVGAGFTRHTGSSTLKSRR